MALTDDITDPRLAKALAHPLRLEILRHLGDRTASPSEIAAEIDAPLTNVSYHVRKLRALGLIKLVRKTPKRGVVEHYYSANRRIRLSDEAWGQTPSIVKQALTAPWAKSAAEVLITAAANGGFERADSHSTRQERLLDEAGWKSAAKVLANALGKLDTIEDESRERLAGNSSVQPIRTMCLMALAEVRDDSTGSEPAGPKRPAARRRSRAASASA